MTLDAAGNVHDDSNGRFAGHLQAEGDTIVLDQPAVSKPVVQQVYDEVHASYDAMVERSKTDPVAANRTYQAARADGLLDALTTINSHLADDPIGQDLRDDIANTLAYFDWAGIAATDDAAVDDEDVTALLVRRIAERLGIAKNPDYRCPSCGGELSGAGQCATCDVPEEEDEEEPSARPEITDGQAADAAAVTYVLACMQCGQEPLDLGTTCPARPSGRHQKVNRAVRPARELTELDF